MYNLSFINTSNNYFEMFIGVNDVSGGLVAGMLLLNLFLLIFIVFKNYDTRSVLLVDSFLVTIISVFMWAGGMIGFKIVILPIVALVASIIFNLFWSE